MNKKVLIKSSILLFIFFFSFACSTDKDNKGAELKQISSKELKEKISKQEEEFTLIDLRSKEKFHKENIQGAVNIPIDSLKSKIADEDFWMEQYLYPPEDSTQIIVYGADEQSGVLGTQELMKVGFKNVSYLKGGYNSYNIKRDKLM